MASNTEDGGAGHHMTYGTSASASVASSGVPDPFAVVAEVREIATASGLWPGFDPRNTPLLLYDGQRTLLFNYPNPVHGFETIPCRGGVLACAGLHPAARANTSIELNGVRVAVVMLPLLPKTDTQRAAVVVIHEMYHVFQLSHHARWAVNDLELLTYPRGDTAILSLRQMEDEALGRALSARDTSEAAGWAYCALGLRDERMAMLPTNAASYERGLEKLEGLAHYVQVRALMTRADATKDLSAQEIVVPRPAAGYGPDQIRPCAYYSGVHMALLLDRFEPAWRSRLEAADSLELDGVLRNALGPRQVMREDFTAQERASYREHATAAIRQYEDDLQGARARFLLRQGASIEIDAAPGHPLWPQGFDPMNLEPLDGNEVLHKRYLKLGNESGSLEVLGREALTLGENGHPLGAGVRRVTIMGLPIATEVDGKNEGVRVKTDGLDLEFAHAVCRRDGDRIYIRLNE